MEASQARPRCLRRPSLFPGPPCCEAQQDAKARYSRCIVSAARYTWIYDWYSKQFLIRGCRVCEFHNRSQNPTPSHQQIGQPHTTAESVKRQPSMEAMFSGTAEYHWPSKHLEPYLIQNSLRYIDTRNRCIDDAKSYMSDYSMTHEKVLNQTNSRTVAHSDNASG